jgi:hypothetical protein
MSKFLLNLLLQISKALVYLKIKFLFKKEFFLHFRPNRPSGQPTHPAFRPSHGPPPLSLRPAHLAFPSPPSLTCGPRPVVFFPGPTAAAAVSRARMPSLGAASAPVTAGAPTPHHSPPHPPADSLPKQPPSFHYGAPPPPPIPLRRPAAPLPLRPYKWVRSSPLLTALIPTPHFPISKPEHAPHRRSDRCRPHRCRPVASLPPKLR